MRLSQLPKGKRGIVTECLLTGDMRRRLQDIGLIEGTIVQCVGISPLKDPAAYLIRGAVIALRCEDAKKIVIEIETGETGW